MVKIKRRIGKSLYLWLKSFVIILIMIIALLVILTTWMVESFSDEIMKLNHSLTSMIQNSVDIRLNDIDNFTSQLELNNTNLNLSKSTTLKSIDSKSLFQLVNQLNDYKMSNAFIEDIYIYYPDLDYVVGDLGYFQSQKYYLLYHNLSYDGYEEWMKNITSHKNKGYYFWKTQNGDIELCFVRCLPYDNSDDKNAIMLIQINKEEVLRILQNDKVALANSLTAIINEDNELYTYFGKEEKLDILEEILRREEEAPFIKIRNYFSSIQGSDFYKIKYITVSDQRQILNTSYFIRNIAYLSIAVCMISGCILFVLMGRRNNRPIRMILEKLKVKPKEEGRHLLDDYSLINSEIDNMLADHIKSQEKAEAQGKTIEGLFLYNLLSNEERNNSIIFASMQRFSLLFEYSLFQVMLIRSKVGFEQEDIKTSISKIINEIKARKEDFYVIATEFKEDIVLLFHMDIEYCSEKLKKTVQELLFCISTDKSSIIIRGGGIYDTMSNIITSYHQAVMLAEINGNTEERVVFYDINLFKKNADVKQSAGAMAEFEMSMLEGNYENAQKLIDLLFNQYIDSGRNVFTVQTKKYAVLNPLIEAMNNISDSDTFDKEYYLQKMSEAKNNQVLLKLMHEIFAVLIKLQREKQTDQEEGVAERARNYINLNFTDSMIGLYSISGVLEISNTYLSTAFKKKYNQGITHYINQLRIEKAKKLILNTAYSMKEIAISVGFSSDVTFIRVFKQFENITPGKFKKN